MKLAMKLKGLLLRVGNLFCPMRIWLDGNDNTGTVNKSLFRMLMHMGIEKNNHIYVFRYEGTYAFVLAPDGFDWENTVTAELKYNDFYNTYGFELLCPTVQQIFFDWKVPHDKVLKCKVTLRKIRLQDSTKDIHIFVINHK